MFLETGGMNIVRRFDFDKFVRVLIYIALFSASFNTSILSISVFGFQLCVFRLILLFLIPIALFFKRKELFKIDKSIRYYIGFMFVWCCYAFLTILWVEDKSSWIQTLYFLGLGFISIYIFSKYIINKNYIYNCFLAFSFSSVVHIIFGINEYLFNNYYFIMQEYLEKYSYNNWPVSTFVNTNNYAFFLGLSLCVFLFIIKASKNIYLRVLYVMVSVLAFFLICATSSRAVLLALMIGGLFLVFNKYVFVNKRKLFNTLLVTGVFMILLTIIISSIIAFTNMDKFQNPIQSTSIRMNLTFNSFYFTIKSYFLGVGAGNFEYHIINNAVFNTSTIINAHNWWLEILSEYGVVIFLGYVLFISLIYIMTQRKFRINNFIQSFQFAMTLFVVVFSIGCISPSSILEMEWMWLLFAVIVSGVQICNNIGVNTNENFIVN